MNLTLAIEGKAQKEAAKAAERAKGKGEELIGKAKNRIGQVIDDDQMAAEGKAKELKGTVRHNTNKPS